MKLYCLSGDPSRPCFVLRYKGTTIMLDCGLDLSTIIHFLPLPIVPNGRLTQFPGWSPHSVNTRLDEELKECNGRIFINSEPEVRIPELGMLDMSEVDVILLSNYHCMQALPFITQYTNFKGVVYATDPTLHIGRQFMEEIVEYMQRTPHKADKWKQPNVLCHLPPPLRDVVSPGKWKKCYNSHDIHACLSKVKTISFNEKTELFGALGIMPVSSGYCIGSCNWIIQTPHKKIAYVSRSSTLTTHPKPLDQRSLKGSDIVIMSGLSQTPTANPDAMIGEFCVNTAVTLKNGGNVLVPCYPSGVTYDLFECLSGHLDNVGLGQVPLYFISPVADSSLAYSNIYSEWLSSGKASKVYIAEHPFPHAELIRNNRLHHYSCLHKGFNNEMKTPCVVFTGHPSLRFGEAVHFLELWGKNPSNTIVLTEPDFPYLEALAPFQPLSMKVAYCPIDTSLSFAQANKLVKDLKLSNLVIAEQYLSPPVSMPQRDDLVVDTTSGANLISYKSADVLNLPSKRELEQIDLDPELASKMVPHEVEPGVAIAFVTGELTSRDNKYVLKPPDVPANKKPKLGEQSMTRPTYVFGQIDVEEFVQQLKEQGIQDVKAEEVPGGYIVDLPNENTLIQLERGSTHIISHGTEEVRVKLKDTLLKCLGQL